MKKDRERQFFGLYKDRGVADLCVQALIAKYDLDIFMKDNQGFNDEVRSILYKEAHKAIDENATVMDVDFDALFDEIEANLHEVAGDKKQRDDYCIELLATFGSGNSFHETYMPTALVRRLKNPQEELSDEDNIVIKKHSAFQLFYMPQESVPSPHGVVENCYMVLYRLLQKYAKWLDWILLKNRIDLFVIQKNCDIYIMDDRVGRDPYCYTEWAGTKKVAQRYLDALCHKGEVYVELNTDKAKKWLQVAIAGGLLNDDYSTTDKTKTKPQKALLADILSDKIGLKYKYKLFEALWDVSGLCKQRYKSINEKGKVEGGDVILKVFNER